MSGRRFFLDTAFVQALFNRADQYHERAVKWLPHARAAMELWITEAVLVEIGNALSATNRPVAVAFAREAYRTPNTRVVTVDTGLLGRALELYTARPRQTLGPDRLHFIHRHDRAPADGGADTRPPFRAGRLRSAAVVGSSDHVVRLAPTREEGRNELRGTSRPSVRQSN